MGLFPPCHGTLCRLRSRPAPGNRGIRQPSGASRTSLGTGSTNRDHHGDSDSTSEVDPSKLEGGYWQGVGQVFRGYGDAVVGTAKGLAFMAQHPIQSAQGLGTAIRHPIQTGQAIGQMIREKSGTLRGQGELVGDVLIGVATGGAAKAASKTAIVARIASRLKRVAGAAKQVGKQVAEEAAQQAGKAAAEQAGKQAAEEAAQHAGKEAVKQAGKQAAEEATQQAGKETAQQAKRSLNKAGDAGTVAEAGVHAPNAELRVARQQVAGQIEEVARRRALGSDLRTGQYRLAEEEAALRLEQRVGRVQRAPASSPGDYVDAVRRPTMPWDPCRLDVSTSIPSPSKLAATCSVKVLTMLLLT